MVHYVDRIGIVGLLLARSSAARLYYIGSEI